MLSLAKATRFFKTTPQPGYVSYESVKYPGMYLIMEDGRLKSGRPLDGNEEFKVEYLSVSFIALKSTGECYVAFNANGKARSPCRAQTSEVLDIRLEEHVFL